MKRYVCAGILLLSAAATCHADALSRAQKYLPLYRELLNEHWFGMPLPHLPCGQVEQESSWKPRATLKTSRELGRGLAQMTIAYRSNGSERFNIYREAVRWKALKRWDWQSAPYNERYQLTFMILQDRMNFGMMRPMFRDDVEAWKATLVCYNAGRGRVLARRAIARSRDSPTDRWTGGLDAAHGPKEDRRLYGRPLWQAVNEYPIKIFRRAEKYRQFFH